MVSYFNWLVGWVVLIYTLNKNPRKSFSQRLGANSATNFLTKLCLSFLVFFLFSAFYIKNQWKNMFQPAFEVHTTQKLVEIFNTYQICAFYLIWKLSKKQSKQLLDFLFLRPSQSCVRGGRPSRPTLAIALYTGYISFVIVYSDQLLVGSSYTVIHTMKWLWTELKIKGGWLGER